MPKMVMQKVHRGNIFSALFSASLASYWLDRKPNI